MCFDPDPPLSRGEPVPGGIRPGPDTGHTPAGFDAADVVFTAASGTPIKAVVYECGCVWTPCGAHAEVAP